MGQAAGPGHRFEEFSTVSRPDGRSGGHGELALQRFSIRRRKKVNINERRNLRADLIFSRAVEQEICDVGSKRG